MFACVLVSLILEFNFDCLFCCVCGFVCLVGFIVNVDRFIVRWLFVLFCVVWFCYEGGWFVGLFLFLLFWCGLLIVFGTDFVGLLDWWYADCCGMMIIVTFHLSCLVCCLICALCLRFGVWFVFWWFMVGIWSFAVRWYVDKFELFVLIIGFWCD